MITLLDFQENDRIKRYVFESGFIKFLSLEFMKVFESKERLLIKRKTRGKGKESRLVFAVEDEWRAKESNNENEDFSGGTESDFKTEQEAIDFFIDKVEENKFFLEQNKKGIVFDTQRYFWKINERDEVISKAI